MRHEQPTQRFIDIQTPRNPPSYFATAVSHYKEWTEDERREAAEKAGHNSFLVDSEKFIVDLCTDSGTTTPSAEQMEALEKGFANNAYAASPGHEAVCSALSDVYGFNPDDYVVYLTNQGRVAEFLCDFVLSKFAPKGCVVPSNGHFDTTAANFKSVGMKPIDFFSPELKDQGSNYAFKGNMDLERLKKHLQKHRKQTILIGTTSTNNRGGGQPVSRENLAETRELALQYGIPYIIDACRALENSWFIKHNELNGSRVKVKDIVQTTMSLADVVTLSFKKDAMAITGGALIVKKRSIFVKKYPGILQALREQQTGAIGNPSYGGIPVPLLFPIAQGIREGVRESWLTERIMQVREFGQYMDKLGIPVMKPFGGHAIYIDMNRVCKGSHLKPEDFPGIAFSAKLIEMGVRVCELGAFAFHTIDPTTGNMILPEFNFVRAAVPRRRYTQKHLKYAADCMKEVLDHLDQLPRAIPISGEDSNLRHFEARFMLQ